jgi:predicted nucleic acid-binding protein
VNVDAPQHAASSALLEAASDPSVTLYVTSQIPCEFYSVITSPRRVACGFLSNRSLEHHFGYAGASRSTGVADPARAVAGWMRLLQRHPVTGGNVFDLQIVATMQANGINRIYTFNRDDFNVFPELTVLTP